MPSKTSRNHQKTPRARRLVYAAIFSAVMLVPLACAQNQSTEGRSAAASAATNAEQIDWRTDLDATLSQAQKEGKRVLLRFTATWCPPCRVMDAKVWPDTQVHAALADHYLLVKKDIDEEGSEQLAMKYGVQAIPTIIILDGTGHEISRGGFMNSQKLVDFLSDASSAKKAQATATQ